MRRRYFVPEVIQTSAMDCGPACLKALFAGFGQYLSYGRLRDACQTDVDGTSIDTLENVAQCLGLEVEQQMLPADCLHVDAHACVPALVVTRLPDGATHFVVLWRAHGSWLQVMDPAVGRIWIQRRALLNSLYIHEQSVARADWEEWAQSPSFTAGLRARLSELEAPEEIWADRAHLDAALRLVGVLCDSGVVRSKHVAREVLTLCRDEPEAIPAKHWFAQPIEGDSARVRLRGAVLLSAAGLRPQARLDPLPESLASVRSDPPPQPWAAVFSALREGGGKLAAIAVAIVALCAAGAALEGLLFLGLLESGVHLKVLGQRAVALALVIVLLAGLIALEWAGSHALLHLGRQLEIRLRARLLLKIPALEDRYFRSRLISDMAMRAHALHSLRDLPELAGRFVRCVIGLVLTAIAISWLFPGAALATWFAVTATVTIPLLLQPVLVERDLRLRELGGALSRFYLDALLGSRAIQAHGAQRAVQVTHAAQLADWGRAGLRRATTSVSAEMVLLAVTVVPIVTLVLSQGAVAHGSVGLLLLAYWALTIPAAGQELASIAWSFPMMRNTLVRYLEPLGAPEPAHAKSAAAANRSGGAAIEIDEVTVVAGGHVLLDRASLRVGAGEHVGIVGSSGAGKSTLLGLLLGLHTPAQGCVRVDEAPLDAAQLARLRERTAWIDPQVHLFQASVYENIRYGDASGATFDALESIIETAGLVDVLKRLPKGMQTVLGDGGVLLAGGEGQRIRIARALTRGDARLAIFDEPARGLPREARQRFVSAARRQFAGATLLLVTHDVRDTLGLDRVVVLEGGRVVEQGRPHDLRRHARSRYRALLDLEADAERCVWSLSRWRRVRMTGGVLAQVAAEPE